MPHLLDEPCHQCSTEGQKQGASTHKCQGGEEIVPFSDLKPSGGGKRNISRQKNERKQSRDDDVDRLADRFCQTLRGLRYQSFWVFHQVG